MNETKKKKREKNILHITSHRIKRITFNRPHVKRSQHLNRLAIYFFVLLLLHFRLPLWILRFSIISIMDAPFTVFTSLFCERASIASIADLFTLVAFVIRAAKRRRGKSGDDDDDDNNSNNDTWIVNYDDKYDQHKICAPHSRVDLHRHINALPIIIYWFIYCTCSMWPCSVHMVFLFIHWKLKMRIWH